MFHKYDTRHVNQCYPIPFQAESNKIYDSGDELKLAIVKYVKETEEPVGPEDKDHQFL